MHNDIAGRSIGNDFTFSKHDAAIGNRSNNLNIVCSDNDCVTISCELRQNLDQSLLCSIVKAAGGFIKKKQRGFGGQHDRKGETETLTFGQIARMGQRINIGDDSVEHFSSRSMSESRIAIRGAAFGQNGVVIEQNTAVLWNQSGNTDNISR